MDRATLPSTIPFTSPRPEIYRSEFVIATPGVYAFVGECWPGHLPQPASTSWDARCESWVRIRLVNCVTGEGLAPTAAVECPVARRKEV
jgi:hypothetical protein